MLDYDYDEFENKCCEECTHSYVCNINELACDYNDEIVVSNYQETENYMSCGSFGFRR